MQFLQIRESTSTHRMWFGGSWRRRRQRASPRRIPCSKTPTTTPRFRRRGRRARQRDLHGLELLFLWRRRCRRPSCLRLLTRSRPTIVACDPSPLPTEPSPERNRPSRSDHDSSCLSKKLLSCTWSRTQFSEVEFFVRQACSKTGSGSEETTSLDIASRSLPLSSRPWLSRQRMLFAIRVQAFAVARGRNCGSSRMNLHSCRDQLLYFPQLSLPLQLHSFFFFFDVRN